MRFLLTCPMELKSDFAQNGRPLSPTQMHADDAEDVAATARRRRYIDNRSRGTRDPTVKSEARCRPTCLTSLTGLTNNSP